MAHKSKMYGPQSAYGTTLKTQAGGLVPTKEKHGAAWGISAFLGLIARPQEKLSSGTDLDICDL